MEILTAAQMQALDQRTITDFGLPGRVLMENAARGAVAHLYRRFPTERQQKIGVIAGSGNNGGDGFVMARYLKNDGADVVVFLCADKARLRGDALANFELLAKLDIAVLEVTDAERLAAAESRLNTRQVFIDALLGTGLSKPVRGHFKTVIETLNQSGKPVLAVDLPSGLNADTAQPMGLCVKAAATTTFGFPKIAHTQYPGRTFCGEVAVVDIGIPPVIKTEPPRRQHLITPAGLRREAVSRQPQAHKGNNGHLFLLAGARGKTGAAVLAAQAALRAGAGLVTLGLPASSLPVAASRIPEVMTLALDETPDGVLAAAASNDVETALGVKDGLALGPGLGTADDTAKLVYRLIGSVDVPMVIDADGLNIIARQTGCLEKIRTPPILTPHPGEMARLAGESVTGVMADRVGCARRFAQKWNVHLVLKGAGTVVAHPDGNVDINLTGNAGMGCAGMGDVLTGLIAGFIVQGYPPAAACRRAVWLHGAAGDRLVRTSGPQGFLASELAAAVPAVAATLASCLIGQKTNFVRSLAELYRLPSR